MTTSKPIQVQIHARVAVPRNGRRVPESIIREAIIHKSQTLEDVPGIELEIVNWSHGSSTKRAANNDMEWINFGRWLQSERCQFAYSATYHHTSKIRSR